MKTVEICGHQVSESVADTMNAYAEMFNIEIKHDFIPKFYCDILKNKFTLALILSEKEDGQLIKDAFSFHAKSNHYFPIPLQITNAISAMAFIES